MHNPAAPARLDAPSSTTRTPLPVPLPTATQLDAAAYHLWLDQVRPMTDSSVVHRLIDDVHHDLSALGHIDRSFAPVIEGALRSVGAAVAIERAGRQ